jgi:hypothetical protein
LRIINLRLALKFIGSSFLLAAADGGVSGFPLANIRQAIVGIETIMFWINKYWLKSALLELSLIKIAGSAKPRMQPIGIARPPKAVATPLYNKS